MVWYNTDMSKSRQYRCRKVTILVTVGGASGREQLGGIFRFIDEGHHWRPDLLHTINSFTPEAVQTAEADGTDGFIVTWPPLPETKAVLLKSNLPVVFVNVPDQDLLSRNAPTAHICTDNVAIGRIGAQFLVSRGTYSAFAFVHAKRNLGFSDMRLRGFDEELRHLGLQSLPAYDTACEEGSADDIDALGDWLAALPRQSAVMAACDWRAVQVLKAAQRAHIHVPGQVSVLGVDNDEIISGYSQPPLSSVHPGHADMGYKAAMELERLMNGGRRARFCEIHIAPKRVVERESTGFVKPAAHLVARAKKFIAENALLGADTADVVAHLGCSRTLADLRFREIEGLTIHAALEERRMGEVKRLLKSTRRSVKAIAAQCGFRSACRLSHLFRQRTGMSIHDWRCRYA